MYMVHIGWSGGAKQTYNLFALCWADAKAEANELKRSMGAAWFVVSRLPGF